MFWLVTIQGWSTSLHEGDCGLQPNECASSSLRSPLLVQKVGPGTRLRWSQCLPSAGSGTGWPSFLIHSLPQAHPVGLLVTRGPVMTTNLAKKRLPGVRWTFTVSIQGQGLSETQGLKRHNSCFYFDFVFLIMCTCVSLCVYVRCPWRPEGVSVLPELELQAFVSLLTWLSGTKLEFSGSTVSTFSSPKYFSSPCFSLKHMCYILLFILCAPVCMYAGAHMPWRAGDKEQRFSSTTCVPGIRLRLLAFPSGAFNHWAILLASAFTPNAPKEIQ